MADLILAPLVGGQASVRIILSAVLIRSVEVTDADMVPGHLTTVWWDDDCACRHVEIEPIEQDSVAPGQLVGWETP